MAKDQVQWDLLPDECAQLRERLYAKIGNVKLIEAIQRTLSIQAQAESSWWETLKTRLEISEEDATHLIADHELGKVWVSGKVKEFDGKRPGVFENPCL